VCLCVCVCTRRARCSEIPLSAHATACACRHAIAAAADLGAVFLCLGVGAILGAVASGPVYSSAHGSKNAVIAAALLCMCALLVALPSMPSPALLNAAYMACGVVSGVADTGCQLMSRRVHGSRAGPWLGVNTLAFSLGGALVPCIGYMQLPLRAQFALQVSVHQIVLRVCAPHAKARLFDAPRSARTTALAALADVPGCAFPKCLM
jgi:MFS family permease